MLLINDELTDEFLKNSINFDLKSLKSTRPPCCYTCDHLMYGLMPKYYYCNHHKVILTSSVVSDLVYKICDNYKPKK